MATRTHWVENEKTPEIHCASLRPFSRISMADRWAALVADYGGHTAQMPGDDGMIVMAGSLESYGVLARPGKSAGKMLSVPLLLSSGSAYAGTAQEQWHTAVAQPGTIRYNEYSTSGWRSRNRQPRSQSIQSRGRFMQGRPRITKKYCRVAIAAPTLRHRLVSKHKSSIKCEKEKQSCIDLQL